MKILYLITLAEHGGGQTHVLDLIRGFRHQFEIELAAGEDGYLLDEARKLAIVCHVVPNLVRAISPSKDARALRDLIVLLRDTHPDLVHVHTSKAGILGRLAAKLSNIPVVFTAHTWCFAEGTSWKWKLLGTPCERLAAMDGGIIINVSSANREIALRHRVAPPERLVTIHNGIPDEPLEPRESTSQVPTILMVARFAPQKDHSTLLDAAARLNSPFRLQFAGSGPTLLEAKRKAEQLGLSDRTEFLGFCSDVSTLLRTAAIFALPTNWEGFPISILEAMRAGLPVVTSDVGGVREAVADGVSGFVLSRGDVNGFARALEILLKSDELRSQMGRKARRLFEQDFTSEHMLRKTFDVYRRAVRVPLSDYKSSAPSSLTDALSLD
jgi:glycosyltransferase involved in cell wall biosynthesis